jgi:fibro-slime domain-containing protein
MKEIKRNLISLSAIVFFALILVQAAPANTLTLNANYFSVTPDLDFHASQPSSYGTYSNMVTSTLGPNGLPVYNPSYGGPAINDITPGKEITWWSPALNSHVTASGTGTITLPFSDNSMYPPMGNGSNDTTSFLTAIFSGILTLPFQESVSFTLGSDDDSFLYIDGSLVTSVGGIHSDTQAPVSSKILTAGAHTLTLFYADRNRTNAALDFSVNTSNVNLDPVPEPSSMLLLGSGLMGLGVLARKRMRK